MCIRDSIATEKLNRKLLKPKDSSILNTLNTISEYAKKTDYNSISLREFFGGIYESLLSEVTGRLDVENKKNISLEGGTTSFFVLFEGMVNFLSLKPRREFNVEDLKTYSTGTDIYNETYCMDYAIDNSSERAGIEKVLADLGEDFIVTLAADKLVKIHTHSLDPKKVFDRTSRFGRPIKIRITDASKRIYENSLQK